ncbi:MULTISPECIES: DUF934 domain-containing protein [Thauera]|uniref:Putative sulfite reductase subunit n=1 Tax=Thauera aromatica K172 TaxID=44139 RepID=A0A2R4BLZ3_THAAR|nr:MULTISPECIES: DUF934 domain-containing protein [Thauera]AVR88349.1 putative sulfite reductase subunit [Thauera aromatica K172]KIN91634.1 hypothetical protein PO78_3787 [Thauera sp. SWB20]
MKPLIRDGRIVDDDWVVLDGDDGQAPDLAPSGARQIVPIALYRAHADALRHLGHRIGIALGPEDDPEVVLPYMAHVSLIAIRFPNFTDGRGYSTARLLRSRFGYAGELRAIGDVLRDQLYFLHRCGFDAFALRPDQDPDDALGAFGDYTWRPVFGAAAAAQPGSPREDGGEPPRAASVPDALP